MEQVYDAYFKLRASELQCYPKIYTLAAQIPLESNHESCNEIDFCEDLISVSIWIFFAIRFINLIAVLARHYNTNFVKNNKLSL